MGYQPKIPKTRKTARLQFTIGELEILCDAIMCMQLEKDYDKNKNILVNKVFDKCNCALRTLIKD